MATEYTEGSDRSKTNRYSQVMPPPPVGVAPTPILFSLITIHLMMGITLFLQAVVITVAAFLITRYAGAKLAAFGTFLLSASYFVLINRSGPDPADGIYAAILSLLGFGALYLAICRFASVRFSRLLVYAAIPLGVVFIATSGPVGLHPLTLPTVTSSCIAIVTITTGVSLLKSDNRRFRVASYLTAAPMILFGLLVAFRLVISLVLEEAMLPGPTAPNLIAVMALFVLSFLWSVGFVLLINQRLQTDLDDLARNDALTELKNRRAMRESLEAALATRSDGCAIVLIDLDHFKHVNDRYGHAAGDRVLQTFAERALQTTRTQDEIGRWGGEEFLLMLRNTDVIEAHQIAERLRVEIAEQPVVLDNQEIKLTFSAGVSWFDDEASIDLALKAADDALYKAKESRNTVVVAEATPLDRRLSSA